MTDTSSIPAAPTAPLVDDELDILESLVDLQEVRLIELGCGNAGLARELLQRHAGAELIGLEVDERQHARNLASPQAGLHFVHAGAQAIPLRDASFDGALMLKSLHHVPLPMMGQALAEIARVLRPQGWLYVSEPVYAGALNELVRLFNDEAAVRVAAQQALDEAVHRGGWQQLAEVRFDMPVHFRDFADFEQRMMRPSWAEHAIDDALLQRLAERYRQHQGPDGARLTRPMHVRLLRRCS
jgi:SAM-dependent methyltransferase